LYNAFIKKKRERSWWKMSNKTNSHMTDELSEKEFLESCVMLKNHCLSIECGKGEPCLFRRTIEKAGKRRNICLTGRTRPINWILPEQNDFPNEYLDRIVTYCSKTPCVKCPFYLQSSPKYPWNCMFEAMIPRFLYFDTDEMKIPSEFDSDYLG
jgi:hypothetical protein